MASEKGASSNNMDERLAQVRDSVLREGEEIVAEAMGDQSQAIILTNTRVLIIKVGLTVTGELNGQKISTYLLDEIKSVNVRKGPLGAVIQICTGNESNDVKSGPPDNVIIFTGQQRVKKCDVIAARISDVISKSANKTEDIQKSEPQADAGSGKKDTEDVFDDTAAVMQEESIPVENTPKAGKERKSLAEEMFEEITQVQQPPQAEAHSVPAVEEAAAEFEPEPSVPEPVVEAEAVQDSVEEEIKEEQPEPIPDFTPNPFLPKPAMKKNKVGRKVLALFGVLTALVLAGIAVTAPMRMSINAPLADIDMTALMNNTSDLRQGCIAIDDYKSEAKKILQVSNDAVASVRSGNISSAEILAAIDITDKSWEKLSKLKAPAGLAGAKESLLSGLFVRKTTLSSIVSDTSLLNSASARNKFAEADMSIRNGLCAIDIMRSDLEKQIAENQKQLK